MVRAAGTFQDRLVTELRLARARTIDQDNTVLRDFLPRYNAQFFVNSSFRAPLGSIAATRRKFFWVDVHVAGRSFDSIVKTGISGTLSRRSPQPPLPPEADAGRHSL